MKNQFYFHVSKSSRNKYSITPDYFSIKGNLIIADFAKARIISEKINSVRRSEGAENSLITPGLINGAALLHEVYHFVISQYIEKQNPNLFLNLTSHLNDSLGQENVDNLFSKFLENFPPPTVFNGSVTIDEYINGATLGKANKEIIFEELLLLYIENRNPSIAMLKELFDENVLDESGVYKTVLENSVKFFKDEEPVMGNNLSLFEYLFNPISAHPEDIEAQLRFILNNWNVSEIVLLKILSGTDLIAEDSKLFPVMGGGGSYTPPVPVYKSFGDSVFDEKGKYIHGQKYSGEDEISSAYINKTPQFTPDTDWMPRVVMIAKNSFVWLDQLSKKYNVNIKTLDQIPDIELDILRDSNFNALWLIGVWERSSASKKIKQYCGNHDAVASAYSLFDYEIANELGGYHSYENLRDRCSQRGIKLASDMVPNHTGIFSKWVLENPDYFIQSSYSPYPSYSFTGPNLSDNSNYEIRIEDKYFTRQDAAVVFQLRNVYEGSTRYIYHGNDGTNMPWNDTAQLNLLNPEVRESLYQKIKHVAQMFPIIRFDAAMTLTKKHYQRLWFPLPGRGGDIASRSDFAHTREMFDNVMPNEFWREVVDRMTQEMPDTLLLAEAFWLMEGYFVRTLGMHRVYNSAFMHMFMKEENSKYRELIRNTLEYNPQILKRYVNFMSNPDEETSINQFGKGDKYFGVCVMLVTLPGLPMFAHGQIEGFTEKYGMEYQRAYYNEVPDEHLLERHKREIFPLMSKRYLFSDVINFWLYDFINEHGGLNENVIAFSNACYDEKVFVVFNNSYEQTRGRVFNSTGKVFGDAQSNEHLELVTNPIGVNLGIERGDNNYYIIKEHKSNFEYLFSANDLISEGMNIVLNGYEYKVFSGFELIQNTDGTIWSLYERLNGNGVPSIKAASREIKTMKYHDAVMDLFNDFNLNEFKSIAKSDVLSSPDFTPYLKSKFMDCIHELEKLGYVTGKSEALLEKIKLDLLLISDLQQIYFPKIYFDKKLRKVNLELREVVVNKLQAYDSLVVIFDVILVMLSSIREKNSEKSVIEIYDELILSKPLWQNFIRLEQNYDDIWLEFELLRLMLTEIQEGKTRMDDVISKNIVADYLIKQMKQKEIAKLLGVNEYQGIKYFSKEKFEVLALWYYWMSVYVTAHRYEISTISEESTKKYRKLVRSTNFRERIAEITAEFQNIIEISKKSNYVFDELIKGLESETELVSEIPDLTKLPLIQKADNKSEIPVKTKASKKKISNTKVAKKDLGKNE